MPILSLTINHTRLLYRDNSHDVSIIKEIWEHRHYDKHFPFRQKVAVIDIGGHCGYFALYAASHLDPEGRVYSYEPAAENFDLLVRNCRRNQARNITAENIAIGARDGFLRLFLNRAHTGGHSVFRERVEVYPHSTIDQVEVPCASLATIVAKAARPIGFCKMDCEGAEFDVLTTADRAVLERIPVFCIEFHEFGGRRVGELADALSLAGHTVSYEFTPSRRGLSFGMLWARRGC